MGKADRLSKRLNWKVGIKNDNKNQKLIKKFLKLSKSSSKRI